METEKSQNVVCVPDSQSGQALDLSIHERAKISSRMIYSKTQLASSHISHLERK